MGFLWIIFFQDEMTAQHTTLMIQNTFQFLWNFL